MKGKECLPMPRPAPPSAAAMLAACLALGGCADHDGTAAVIGGVATGGWWPGSTAPAAAPEAAPAAPPAEVALEDGGAGAAADPAIVLPASIVAALAGLRLLDTAGRAAVPRAEARHASATDEMDRCALEVFIAVAAGAGPAEGARFAVWLTDRARARGEQDAIAGLAEVATGIVEEVRAGAAGAEPEAARLLGFEDPERLRETVGVARDAGNRCPGGAAGRLGAWLAEAEPA
jgi:hypothetical protein